MTNEELIQKKINDDITITNKIKTTKTIKKVKAPKGVCYFNS